MRVSYNIPLIGDDEKTCEVLEDLSEAIVDAMCRETSVDKEKFPCCIKCGGFAVSSAPGFPVPGCDPISRDARTLHIRSAAEILRAGCGSSFDLACYQVAQKRLRGDDPGAVVIVDLFEEGRPGQYQAMVLHSDRHKKPEKRRTIDKPIESAKAVTCECLGHEGNG